MSLDYLVRGGDGTTTTAADKITMSLYALRLETDNDPGVYWEELPERDEILTNQKSYLRPMRTIVTLTVD